MLGTKPKTAVTIRPMTRRDLPAVLAVERASFAAPLSEDGLLRLLRYPTRKGDVAEHRGHVAGFMVYELCVDRLYVCDIATHPDFRRAGVGRQMLDKLVDKLCRNRLTRITLEVRETNLVAQRFYRDCGFRAVGVVRSYYDDTGEDGYEFAYALAGHRD